MLDILDDSVMEIAQHMYTDAYGGRLVEDFYETPAQFTLRQCDESQADAHVDVHFGSFVEGTDEIVSMSETGPHADLYFEGQQKSSKTRNTFIATPEAHLIQGMFGEAVSAVCKLICIARANGEDGRSFESFFREEWGLDNDYSLEPFIPKLSTNSSASLSAIVENRNPDIFVHPNSMGPTIFQWHDITRDKLSKRAKREVSCDFAKCRAMGEFHARMLRNESFLDRNDTVRLFYRIDTNEVPNLNAYKHLALAPHGGPPSAFVSHATLVGAFAMLKARAAQQARWQKYKSDHLEISSKAMEVLQPISHAPPPLAPATGLTAATLHKMLETRVDRGPLAPPEAFNWDIIKVSRVDVKRHFAVSVSELPEILSVLLPPKLMLVGRTLEKLKLDPKCKEADNLAKEVARVPIVSSLNRLALILYGKSDQRELFVRRVLRSFGLQDSDFHHKVGEEIFLAALNRIQFREQFYGILAATMRIRMNAVCSYTYMAERFWQTWHSVGSFEAALNRVVENSIQLWCGYYRGKWKTTSVILDKIRNQLYSTFLKAYTVYVGDELEVTAEARPEVWRSKLSTMSENYNRKRQTAKMSPVIVNLSACVTVPQMCQKFDVICTPKVKMQDVYATLENAKQDLVRDVEMALERARDGFFSRDGRRTEEPIQLQSPVVDDQEVLEGGNEYEGVTIPDRIITPTLTISENLYRATPVQHMTLPSVDIIKEAAPSKLVFGTIKYYKEQKRDPYDVAISNLIDEGEVLHSWFRLFLSDQYPKGVAISDYLDIMAKAAEWYGQYRNQPEYNAKVDEEVIRVA